MCVLKRCPMDNNVTESPLREDYLDTLGTVFTSITIIVYRRTMGVGVCMFFIERKQWPMYKVDDKCRDNILTTIES